MTWYYIVVLILVTSVPVMRVMAEIHYLRGYRAEPRRIPAAIRAEIDQTPEWWDAEFRRLSAKVDGPRETFPLTGWGALGVHELHSKSEATHGRCRCQVCQFARNQYHREFSTGGWIR